MVTTRASRIAESEDAKVSSSSEEEVSSTVQVSLESSTDADESPAPSKPTITEAQPLQGASRLFTPYRTLGIVSSGRPYHVQTHSNSSNALVTLPIGKRFHVMQCDRLQPVLVSQGVGGDITHVVADSSLSVTVVAHEKNNVTLFQRTRPVQTLTKLASKEWSVVDMLHLGKVKVEMTGEKEGSTENALVVAVILSKQRSDEEEGDDVPVHGDDSDSSDDDDDNDSNDDDSSMEDQEDCLGQVVMLIATRTSIRIQQRIPLTKIPAFQPTVAMHPSTYLNKIVLGGTDSSLILLNVRTAKIIHVFTCLPKSNNRTTVTALEQSPAVDTIGVGMSDGNVHLVNLRHDKKLFTLKHKGTSITSLSFRTDGSAMRYGIAPLAVGRSDGTVTIWDLTPPEEEQDMGRALLCELTKVHSGGVAKLSYFPQEPLLLSIGTTSNSLLMHVFDNPDHSGRLLRQRRGHVSPPKHIRYLHPANNGTLANSADGTDASSCQILSGGGADRTVRIFSTARSVLDKEYSQGQGLEKRAKQLGLDSTLELLLPPVTAMAMSEAKSRDWGDIVSIHANHPFAYVWSSKRGAQSGPILRQDDWNVSAMQVPPPKSTHATSVTISSCGNFALVGTVGGVIYKYNVQSGLARGTYPKSAASRTDGSGRPRMAGDVNRTMKALEKKMKISNRPSDVDKEERDAVLAAKMEQKRLAALARGSHTGAAVTGLAVDSVNKTLVSVGSDAKLILWNFATHAPHKKSPFALPSPATKLCHVRDSDLAAIAMEDFTIVLFDCATLSIVRRFGVGSDAVQHSGPISDLGFSPDGRNLYSSSLDGTVRVWDVPTNTCVDWLGFHTPPTSLTVSPTGEFLATTHADKVGISLWSDRTFYQTVHMDGAHPPTEPARMDDPAPIAETADASEDGIRNRQAVTAFASAPSDKDNGEDSKLPPTAKGDGLITLSGMPPAHWKNLFHLELVKERNKPKEAPKKPPSAPFFLQWRGGESLGGDVAAKDKGQQETAPGEAADEEAWDAVWSDDDDGTNAEPTGNKRPLEKPDDKSTTTKPKRPKITHHRSHLAALLEECYKLPATGDGNRFQAVTNHVATLGPSAIDVSLSTLCSGTHDLEEGLPLLHKASLWLLETCQSRQRYEAVNAYLHRFLYLHANILAGIDSDTKQQQVEEETELTGEEREANDRLHAQRKGLLETVSLLKEAQEEASNALRGKMQHTLCLLRHFSRMV